MPSKLRKKRGKYTISPPFSQVTYPRHPKDTSLHLNRRDQQYIFQRPPPILCHTIMSLSHLLRGNTSQGFFVNISDITYREDRQKHYKYSLYWIVKCTPLSQFNNYFFQKKIHRETPNHFPTVKNNTNIDS